MVYKKLVHIEYAAWTCGYLTIKARSSPYAFMIDYSPIQILTLSASQSTHFCCPREVGPSSRKWILRRFNTWGTGNSDPI